MAGTKTYPLTGGSAVLIDEEDYDLVQSFGKWYLSDTGYAVKKTRVQGVSKTFRMHRVINNTPDGMVTDHINGNRLDNRKSNLRTVTQMLNTQNHTTVTHGNRKYKDLPKGVTWDASKGKYYATRTERKRFDNLDDAINFTKGEI